MGQKVCHFYKAKNHGLMSKVGQHKDLRGQASCCFLYLSLTHMRLS